MNRSWLPNSRIFGGFEISNFIFVSHSSMSANSVGERTSLEAEKGDAGMIAHARRRKTRHRPCWSLKPDKERLRI